MVRFGIRLPSPTGAPADGLFDQVAAMAAAAEAAGFDSVWVEDRVGIPVPSRREPVFEAYTLLGAVAARTSRVRLGAMVTGSTSRNPGVVAKLVTTLDVISGGRAVLGIGAENRTEGHMATTAGYTDEQIRLDMLEEAVQVCRALFTKDDVTFEGTHFQLDHARNLPRPVQPGGPKILIYGGGGQATLALAARYADQCGLTGGAATLARSIESLHRHSLEVGRQPEEVDVIWTGPLVVATSDGEAARLRRTLTDQIPGGAADDAIVGCLSDVPELIVGHLEAGAGELVFGLPLSDPEAVAGLGEVLGLAVR